jgi:hypothetical protein
LYPTDALAPVFEPVQAERRLRVRAVARYYLAFYREYLFLQIQLFPACVRFLL